MTQGLSSGIAGWESRVSLPSVSAPPKTRKPLDVAAVPGAHRAEGAGPCTVRIAGLFVHKDSTERACTRRKPNTPECYLAGKRPKICRNRLMISHPSDKAPTCDSSQGTVHTAHTLAHRLSRYCPNRPQWIDRKMKASPSLGLSGYRQYRRLCGYPYQGEAVGR